MSNVPVLVVDNDADVRQFVGDILGREGARVSLAGGGREALAQLRQQPFQVLFTALAMPDIDGLTLLREALRVRPQLAAVLFTPHAKVDSCIEALRLGACDYMPEPLTAQMIRDALARAVEACQRKGLAAASGAAAGPSPGGPAQRTREPDDQIVAESPAMRAVCELVAKIAATDAAVLITGEPGVGKTLVARTIHRQSTRAAGPFVHVNCGAIPEVELDMRLFGPEEPKPGEAATGCQGLGGPCPGRNALPGQRRAPAAVGPGPSLGFAPARLRRRSAQPLPVDVRVIASTSCDLEAAVAEGRFLRKLYYLLDVVAIQVPPLHSASRLSSTWPSYAWRKPWPSGASPRSSPGPISRPRRGDAS